MEESTSTYCLLRIAGGELPSMLAYQVHKRQVFVSPHTKAVDVSRGAHLRSLELANRAATALAPVVRRRYGDGAGIEIVPVREGGGETSTLDRLHRRIEGDSTMLDARIPQRVFAPNKAPLMR